MFNLFKKRSIGLDISDRTIEVVELEKSNGVKIVASGRIEMDSGVVERGRIKDEKKLLEIVKKVFKEAKPRSIVGKEIVFGLSESQVYSNVFTFNSDNSEKKEEVIAERAKKIFPLAGKDLIYSHKIISQTKKEEEILLMATSRQVVLEWQNFFKKAGLEINIFDVEALAVFRSLFFDSSKRPVCLVDIGSEVTNVAIFSKKGLQYSYSISRAGNFFTQQIAERLNIELEEADKRKRDADLSKTDEELVDILITSLEPILKEIKVSFESLEGRADSVGEEGDSKVKEIILIGGSSRIKGLAGYFSVNLGVEVINSSALGVKDSLFYLEAVGLALRGVDKKWDENDLRIDLTD